MLLHHLSITLLLLFYMICSLFFASATTSDDDKLVPVSRYRSPKNIVFSTVGGGSSHHMWVLEILEEMYKRGHQVSFYTRGDQLRFADDYPIIAKQVGGPYDFVRNPLVTEHLTSHPKLEDVAMGAIEASMTNYTEEFDDLVNRFKSENISLVICDSFAVSCIDSAIYSKLPVILTSTFGLYADNGAPYINNKLYDGPDPTTQDESLWRRVYRKYILFPRLLWSLSRKMKEPLAYQKSVGLGHALHTSAARFNHVPKLINNVFGIEAPRKLSPLVHMVGPILRKSYPQLDPATQAFLDSRERVAYISFGQHAVASDEDIKMILHGLLRLKELGHIDGIFWTRLTASQLPSMFHTPDHLYSNQQLMDDPDIYLIDWAPQFGVLQHSSISFFISHGGVGSLHEALYSNVRLLVFPYFGDQPSNARSIQRIGLGKYVDTLGMKYDDACYQSFYETVYQVAVDPGNTIQDTVNRYSAYVQVMATNAVVRGADLLEESLFASDHKGELYYRLDVAYEINWFKRHNFDVYAVIAIFNLVLLTLTFSVWSHLRNNSKKIQL